VAKKREKKVPKRPEKRKKKAATAEAPASPPSASSPGSGPTAQGSGTTLPSTTAEFVRQVARQTRSHARTAALILGLVVIAGGAGAYLLLKPGAPVAPAAGAAETSTDGVEAQSPTQGQATVTEQEAKQALKRAPKPIASLLKGAHPKAPDPSSKPTPPAAVPDDLPSALRSQRFNAYDLARSIASDRKGAVQLCYERQLKRDPSLKGRVTVDLQLKAPHQVGEVRVVDNLKVAAFTTCVESAMRHIDFPVLREDLAFEIPFALVAPDL
jgi:hypothetical protein